MPTYSTVEVAELVGVTWDTLSRWVREKKFPVPPVRSVGRIRVRIWTDDDVAKVKKYKAEHYWGKGGRQKRKKRTK
jgi:excisionase family DNA binding protein